MSWDSKERRKFVRVKFPCEIVVEGSQGEKLPAQAENISAGGLRLILKQKFKASSTVKISIYLAPEELIKCEGRVVWVFSRRDPQDENNLLFDTGIEFSQIDNKDVEKIKKIVSSIAKTQDL